MTLITVMICRRDKEHTESEIRCLSDSSSHLTMRAKLLPLLNIYYSPSLAFRIYTIPKGSLEKS